MTSIIISSVERNPFHYSFSYYRKDSFSDRVCDDLSEVILQFLPIQDKFRLECVSKQFQRTVFEKHLELSLAESQAIEERIKCKAIHLKTFLEKMSNIRSLSSLYRNKPLIEDKDVDLVIKYSNRLEDIHCDFDTMSERRRDEFVAKFGSKLVSLSAETIDLKVIANSFPKLEALNTLVSSPNRWNSDQLSNLVFKKLKRLCIRFKEQNIYTFNKYLESFQTFFERHKSLTHLRIDVFVTNETTFDFLFKNISNLDQLIEIHFKFCDRIPDNILANGLKQISQNCLKLKVLIIETVTIEETSKNIHFIKVLKNFKQLKKLEIIFSDFPQTSPDFDPYKTLNQSFNGLENITYLTLKFYPQLRIRETLLTDIDKYMPKLQYLYIGNQFFATKLTADILSQLSSLRVLALRLSNCVNQSIRGLIDTKVRKNCRKIISIKLKF